MLYGNLDVSKYIVIMVVGCVLFFLITKLCFLYEFIMFYRSVDVNMPK